MLSKFKARLMLIVGMAAIVTINPAVRAQNIEFLTILDEYTPTLLSERSDGSTISDWIWLNGRPTFKIASNSREALDQRVEVVQENLDRIFQDYLRQQTDELNIEVRDSKGLNVIYVNDAYLMSVTALDAEIMGIDNAILSEILVTQIKRELIQAKAERTIEALPDQTKEAAITLLVALVLSAGLTIGHKKLKRSIDPHSNSPNLPTPPGKAIGSIHKPDRNGNQSNGQTHIAEQGPIDEPSNSELDYLQLDYFRFDRLNQNGESKQTTERRTTEDEETSAIDNLAEHSSAAVPVRTNHALKHALQDRSRQNIGKLVTRVFQLANASIWGIAGLRILNTFPHTRVMIPFLLKIVSTPLRIGGVIILSYFAIRLSYVLIDQFISILVNEVSLQNTSSSQRLRMRLSTVSQIIKSISTIAVLVIAFLITLMVLAIDIAPILAGAGIIGFALSFASQNLIRDAINGFFIILEDQYAVGDVIVVGTVGGFVEYMNLRITQLRDTEGRLITIPNSEIKIVANHSSHWSQSDIFVPIAYGSDVDKALAVVEQVALELANDDHWGTYIYEQPNILGVDDFKEKCLLIRLWIKTQPLKQWDVAREYRRRVKIALEQAGIPIPMSQQEIWFNNSSDVMANLNQASGYLAKQGDRYGVKHN
ncbi:MscS Mechanosensitive ion channel [Thalassoporum mexicanum PCC 7367]|uniref:mechanosensitive ion channel family protein n=1 Tax=Thalassoporum mexicanum TaxID=3457544 RepID=UPI00029F83D4|nr:mechanosensitive ion channel family protein [Pseudanabaena sp. PCC 7367]AFY69906.1 MscS Mechanosensitive ion channel [Pseudanabaena sp. PCC 7367]